MPIKCQNLNKLYRKQMKSSNMASFKGSITPAKLNLETLVSFSTSIPYNGTKSDLVINMSAANTESSASKLANNDDEKTENRQE